MSLAPRSKSRYQQFKNTTKLGHGGTDYIATVLGCDPKTIRHGPHDLEALPPDTRERMRRKGGDANGA